MTPKSSVTRVRAKDISTRPIGIAEFAGLMRSLNIAGRGLKPERICCAVSGGADSMALTLLCARWAARQKIAFTALTIDHGLRAQSKFEARQVGRWMRARGIAHNVLTWQGAKPGSNVQAAARKARYHLLAEWCNSHGVINLLVAHHREDQAETFLLRLMRGSGVDGLAAMSPVSDIARGSRVRLLRPLLATEKSRLLATCDKFRQPWIDDPSNQNETFARVRVRKLMAAYESDGLSASRLVATAGRMAQAVTALEQVSHDFIHDFVTFYAEGYAEIDENRLAAVPREIGLRALARILGVVGGGVYRPRYDRLNDVFDAACRQSIGRGRTLAGCFLVGHEGKIRVVREIRHFERVSMRPGQAVIWDGRFEVRLDKRRGSKNIATYVDALGRADWSEIRPQIADSLRQSGRDQGSTNLPVRIRQSLPSLWQGGKLLAVPHFGFAKNALGRGFSAAFCRP